MECGIGEERLVEEADEAHQEGEWSGHMRDRKWTAVAEVDWRVLLARTSGVTGAAGGIHAPFLGEQSLQELARVCFRDAGRELWD